MRVWSWTEALLSPIFSQMWTDLNREKKNKNILAVENGRLMCTWRKSGMLAFSWVQHPHKKQWLTEVTNAQLLEKLEKKNNTRTRIENIQKRKIRTIDFNPWWYHRNTKNISSDRKFKNITGKDGSRKTTIRKEGKQGYGGNSRRNIQIVVYSNTIFITIKKIWDNGKQGNVVLCLCNVL